MAIQMKTTAKSEVNSQNSLSQKYREESRGQQPPKRQECDKKDENNSPDDLNSVHTSSQKHRQMLKEIFYKTLCVLPAQ